MTVAANTDRTILGLLRLIGWQSGRDQELTKEEAELILEVAATQPVSDDDRARLRDRVLNSLSGRSKEEGGVSSELTDATAWLIEYRHGDGVTATYWAGGKEFTYDPNRAIRFTREEDAARVLRSTDPMVFSTKCYAAEHMWCDRKATHPSTPATRLENEGTGANG